MTSPLAKLKELARQHVMTQVVWLIERVCFEPGECKRLHAHFFGENELTENHEIHKTS